MADEDVVDLRMLPLVLAKLAEQRGEPLEVVLPAEPPEHARRLLASLNVKWRVAVGVPLTPGEREELRRRVDEASRARVVRTAQAEAEIARLAGRRFREPVMGPAVTVAAGVCKVDGCERPANTRYDRGTFARLCDEHIEEAREEAAARSRAMHDRRRANGQRQKPTQVVAPVIAAAAPAPPASDMAGDVCERLLAVLLERGEAWSPDQVAEYVAAVRVIHRVLEGTG